MRLPANPVLNLVVEYVSLVLVQQLGSSVLPRVVDELIETGVQQIPRVAVFFEPLESLATVRRRDLFAVAVFEDAVPTVGRCHATLLEVVEDQLVDLSEVLS